ncbi:hypothetical protein RRG08_031252 [Elysia crispata]|uniref:Uncharacterized protein n=1 Tax=Elysia crispata TaxID=231223 RepID=A0AAE1DZC7_9GAST|nr:hypothetical protein RRG08_031252 [Elysia crispata]
MTLPLLDPSKLSSLPGVRAACLKAAACWEMGGVVFSMFMALVCKGEWSFPILKFSVFVLACKYTYELRRND